MRLTFVVLLLQVSEELPLEFVDVFNVAEDGFQLQLGKHFWVFTTLPNVTLKTNISIYLDEDFRKKKKKSTEVYILYVRGSKMLAIFSSYSYC